MAKLDRATFSGTPQLVASTSPQRELQKGRSAQIGMQAIGQTADAATTMFKQMENDEASTNMSLEYSRFMDDVQSAGEFITADQARELGYEGPNLMDDEFNDREDIALWEILPDVAKDKYDQLTEKYGAKISGFQNRQEWVNRRRIQSQDYYSKLKQYQNQAFFEQKITESQTAIDEAVQLGDFLLAGELAQNHPDPTQREELKKKVLYSEAVAEVHNTYQSGDPRAMMELASQIVDPEYMGEFSEIEQTSNANMLRQEAQRVVNQAQASRLKEFDQMRTRYNVARDTGSTEAWAALSEMYNYLDRTGQMDYVSKGYFANEWGKLAKAAINEEDNSGIRNAFIAGDYRAINVTDSDHRKVMDQVVNDSIENAIQIAGQVDPEEADQVIQATHEGLIDKSALTGYMPEFYENAIMDLNLPNISSEDAITASTFFNGFATQNPSLVQSIPEETRRVAQEIYTLGQAGIVDQEVIENIKQRQREVNPDVLDRREREFSLAYNQSTQPIQKQLKSRAGPRWWNAFERLFDGERTAEITDRAEHDYAMLVRHHVMNGSTMGDAYELAFQDWSANNQPTRANGRWQYTRHSPEIMYGVTSKEVRTDLKDYVNSVVDLPPDFDGNFEIYPDIMTSTQDRPTYQVYYVDENDMATMVKDSGGRYLRYAPRVDRIKKRSKLDEIEQARKARARSEMGMEEAGLTEIPFFNAQFPNLRGGDSGERDRKIRESRLEAVDQRSKAIAADRAVIESLENQ